MLQELAVQSPDEANATLRHRVIRDRVAQIVCNKLVPYHRANRITTKVCGQWHVACTETLPQDDFKHLSRKLTRQFLDSKGGEAVYVPDSQADDELEAFVDAFFATRTVYRSHSKSGL